MRLLLVTCLACGIWAGTAATASAPPVIVAQSDDTPEMEIPLEQDESAEDTRDDAAQEPADEEPEGTSPPASGGYVPPPVPQAEPVALAYTGFDPTPLLSLAILSLVFGLALKSMFGIRRNERPMAPSEGLSEFELALSIQGHRVTQTTTPSASSSARFRSSPQR